MLKVKWPKVVRAEDRPLVAWIDLGNGTMFRLFAFFVINPRAGFVVGIERVGSFFFDISNVITPFYVKEKLCMGLYDSAIIADWMNAQIGHDAPQFGQYTEKYIKEIEPYALIGEYKSMPLVPEIIK